MADNQKRVLMLQGPLGPFFADLAQALGSLGVATHRICFNKGDWHFAKADHVELYEHPAEKWAGYLTAYIEDNGIHAVCCYGDSRYYHSEARRVCDEMGIPVLCFEEGYVRPGFVTMEVGGNNANSGFPASFQAGKLPEIEPVKAASVSNHFRFQFWFAVLYYTVKDWKLSGFAGYLHHRRGNWATELLSWIRAGIRKHTYSRYIEQGLTENLVSDTSGPLFTVPLQVAVDTQMIFHSPYNSVADFIDEVIRSFAEDAPKNARLVIKHHPMDRGFTHYGGLIKRLSRGLGCADRVTYAFDLDLDRVLKHSAGCVTVNSTVGLTALELGTPTLTLGKSMVGAAGLTAQATLADFWTKSGDVDQTKVDAFKRALVSHTQIPGSFYRDRHIAAAAAAKKLETVLELST